MEHDDIANELFIMNAATAERLFELGADEFLLYSFYYKTAKWQKTTEVWANNEYVMRCLGWGLKKVRAVKNSLVKNGFVEQIRVTDKDTGKVAKWTIKLKYIQGVNHPSKTEPVDEKTTGAILPPVQFKRQDYNNNKISQESYNNNNNPLSSPLNNETENEVVKVPQRGPSDGSVTDKQLFDFWNRELLPGRDNVVGIRMFGPTRKKKFHAVLSFIRKDQGLNNEQEAFEFFKERIMTAYDNSSFLQGKARGYEGFNLDFDFCLQQSSLTKIVEGRYR